MNLIWPISFAIICAFLVVVPIITTPQDKYCYKHVINMNFESVKKNIPCIFLLFAQVNLIWPISFAIICAFLVVVPIITTPHNKYCYKHVIVYACILKSVKKIITYICLPFLQVNLIWPISFAIICAFLVVVPIITTPQNKYCYKHVCMYFEICEKKY